MQNLLATCWFYIIILCGIGIKTFFLSIICYIIDVFSFSFIFSPLKGRYWHRNKMDSRFITLMNLQTVFYPSFSRVFLGGWRWLFVIIKSYVKVNFKEINNNNDNNNINSNNNNNDSRFEKGDINSYSGSSESEYKNKSS